MGYDGGDRRTEEEDTGRAGDEYRHVGAPGDGEADAGVAGGVGGLGRGAAAAGEEESGVRGYGVGRDDGVDGDCEGY